MLSILDPLRDLTMASFCLRMILSVICGGLIGLEREIKRRSAGFRTHILICLGAAMTALTSQYLYLVMNYNTDITRIGAQVVAGIGFIGAGAIITTPKHRVRGLTTAAGLWVSAIIGLCFGSGFYEGGVLATVLLLLAEILFSKLEYYILNHAPEINIYMEYSGKDCLDLVLKLFRDRSVKITNMEITRSTETEKHNACALFSLQLTRRCPANELIEEVRETEGVFSAERL